VRLAAEFQPEQAWLFGAHASGQPDEGSDLDLLVVIRHSDERRAQRAHRCLQGLGVVKDVVMKTRAELERFRHVRSSLEAKASAVLEPSQTEFDGHSRPRPGLVGYVLSLLPGEVSPT